MATEDIAAGLRDTPIGCPVARALARATGFGWVASHPCLTPAEDAGERRLPTPPGVDVWMRRFDDVRPGRDVGPFAFDLDVPDGWLKKD
jgi:hypothetical protein